jgi:hypothetical protein
MRTAKVTNMALERRLVDLDPCSHLAHPEAALTALGRVLVVNVNAA